MESLKQRIKNWFARHPEWQNGGEIERMAMAKGYKGSTASRELRRLARKEENYYLDREERRGDRSRTKSVYYKLRENF